MNPYECEWPYSPIPLRGKRGYVQHLHLLISMKVHPLRHISFHRVILQGFEVQQCSFVDANAQSSYTTNW